MLPDIFRFSLKQDINTWYYWNNGLQTTTSPTIAAGYLRRHPILWQDSESKWTRSRSNFGLIRTTAMNYTFVEDGKNIIRTVYNQGGIESKIYIVIERLSDDGSHYDVFFSGQLDLLNYDFGQLFNGSPIGVNVPVIEGGLSAALNAAENTPFEFALDTTQDARNINMDGIYVQSDAQFIVPNNTSTPIALGNILSTYFSALEGYSAGITVSKLAGTGQILRDLNNDFCYEATINQSARLVFSKIYINFFWPGTETTNARVELWIRYGQAGAGQVDLSIWSPPGGAYISPGQSTTYYIANATATISLNAPAGSNPGDRIAVYWRIKTQTGAYVGTNTNELKVLDDNGKFDIFTTQRNAPSLAASLRYVEVVGKLLDAISGTPNTLQSSILNNPNAVLKDSRPYHCRLTSAQALRQLTTTANGTPTLPKIRVTWRDIQSDLVNCFGLAIGLANNKVVIEPLSYFFNQNNKLADLGEVNLVSVQPTKDYFANSAKWGYPSKTYDAVNGLDEPNTLAVWKYPITSKTADPDNTCAVIRRDMYGIEDTRINRTGKNTTDASSDNDTFLIETEANMVSGSYPLYRPQNNYTQPANTGLLFPTTAYNLAQSPKRNVLRNGGFQHGFLNKQNSSYITYQTSDKNNSQLAIDLGSGVVVERSNILVSSLDPALFNPHIFHIEVISPLTMPSIMAGTGNGYFGFTVQGVYYKGFPMEVGVKEAAESSYQMSLLCTADTDISTLGV
jgi:hypothetical protein